MPILGHAHANYKVQGCAEPMPQCFSKPRAPATQAQAPAASQQLDHDAAVRLLPCAGTLLAGAGRGRGAFGTTFGGGGGAASSLS